MYFFVSLTLKDVRGKFLLLSRVFQPKEEICKRKLEIKNICSTNISSKHGVTTSWVLPVRTMAKGASERDQQCSG